MLSFKEAMQIITASVEPGAPEVCHLDDALGRVLAQDVFSQTTLPAHNSAFKDGYAVRWDEVKQATPENPVRLMIFGESFAGGVFQDKDFAPGIAVKITTGAYLPRGFDTVIPWENCFYDNGAIIVERPPRESQDISRAGCELSAGELLLRKGIALKPADIGLAAAGGHNLLNVVKAPRVGIISTGNELVLPGTAIKEGQIYSSNQFQLKTQIRGMHMHAEAVIIRDDFFATTQGVMEIFRNSDVIISSGGSADSERDFMRHVLKELEWQLLVEDVAVKPGHTLRYGLLYKKPFFVLPGTPTGTEICFNVFVTPLLRKMAGMHAIKPKTVYARLLNKMKGWPKGKNIAQAVLTFEQSGPVLTQVPKECGRIKSIAHKNALVMVPPEGYDAGDIVEAILV